MDCCRNCLLRVTDEEPFVYCNGQCEEIFHPACVGMSKDVLAAVSPPHRNSFWLCDNCFAAFVQWRDTQKKSTERIAPQSEADAIPNALQRDMEELKAEIKIIKSILASTSTCPSGTAIKHSTPRSSPPFHKEPSGLNSEHRTLFTPDATECPSNTNNGDDSFALMLTNIDRSVSERDIRQLVSRCLGACDDECENIKKLVPRWTDCSDLDFVSFKIVLHNKWRSAAMTSSTWPKYIKFREFVTRHRTWIPDNM